MATFISGEAEEAIAKSVENRTKAERRIAELEERLRNVDKYREKETKEAEDRLKKAQKAAEHSGKVLKDKHEVSFLFLCKFYILSFNFGILGNRGFENRNSRIGGRD